MSQSKESPRGNLGIGIDTGGTYTDAVVYDFETRAVLFSAKALTTHEMLSRGILAALDALPRSMVQKASLLSLSTTLATNACVEGKGGRARLIFIGGHPRAVDERGGAFGLPPAREIFFPRNEDDDAGELSKTPDWDAFEREMEDALSGQDGVGIVEMYARWTGAALETEARDRVLRRLSLPAVCGHELFSDLGCFERCAGTLLNARLFPVIQSFLDAIGEAMEARGLSMPVVIVRSDGTLMNRAFTSRHPVETLLCGPAASVMGAAGLAGAEENAVVVDMGGTTTDIALVRAGQPVQAEDGISVGDWKTCVKGLYISTFGLGGDSAIRHRDGALALEPRRVLPLCVLGSQHPEIKRSLSALVESEKRHSHFLHEFFLLRRPIAPEDDRYTAEEKAFCRALEAGPLSYEQAAGALGVDLYNLNADRLVREGVVQVCGLTPTDIMHIRGEFDAHDREAALLGARFVAWNLGLSVEALCEAVYDAVRRKLYTGIVRTLLENQHAHYRAEGFSPDILRLIDEAYEQAKAGGAPLVNTLLRTGFTLVGIGAPTHVFLKDVAALLGARAVVPENAGVANAVGAIMGKVYATRTAEVTPLYGPGGITGYQVVGQSQVYEALEEAVQAATAAAREAARWEAEARGAQGEIAVAHTTHSREAAAKENTVFLGVTVSASAAGSLA